MTLNATKTWDYVYGDNLTLQIIATDLGGGQCSIVVKCLDGYADINALYWNDGIADGSLFSLAPKSVNMNGTGEDWDGGTLLSAPGIGPEGEAKATYLQEGETYTIPSITLNWDTLDTMGVRATSTSTPEGSIKGVDNEPVVWTPPEEEDNFEDNGHALSYATFYFGDDSLGTVEAGDTRGVYDGDPSGGPNGVPNTPDGVLTIKVEFPDGAGNDLDAYQADILQWLIDNDANVTPDSNLLGVAIHAGEGNPVLEEDFYAIDGTPESNTYPDPPVDPAIANEVDKTYQFASMGIDL